jgi:glycosyltransferase involved in cell wall biosynthesis
MKTLSIIIPTYNERESISELYVALKKELNRLDVASEIIFVDDGSADGTGRILRDLQKNDASITIVDFRRNFGKAAALSAGFQMARGDVIVTMDADLQDQPAELHRLLDKLESGYDLVSGWKKVRHDPIGKRWPSRVFNAVTALLTGVPLHDMNCGFKAYRRQVVEEIALYGEMHRYIPVLASYRGFRVGEVVVEHRHRPYGRSKYGITRLFSGFFDLLTVIMLTRYNRKPLHAFGVFGGLMLAIGFVVEAYLSIGWLFGRWIGDRPILLLGILLLIVGMQFIFFGLMAEMIAYSARRDEDFSIREILKGGERVEMPEREREAHVPTVDSVRL